MRHLSGVHLSVAWTSQPVGHELHELVDHAEESSDVSHVLWLLHVQNCLHLGWILFHPFCVDDLAHVIELSLGEFKLLRVECQAALRQSVQHFLQSGIVLVLIFAKDKDIVHMTNLSLQSMQNVVHLLLEILGRRCDAVRKTFESVASIWCDED